jgi:hypothetical protein
MESLSLSLGWVEGMATVVGDGENITDAGVSGAERGRGTGRGGGAYTPVMACKMDTITVSIRRYIPGYKKTAKRHTRLTYPAAVMAVAERQVVPPKMEQRGQRRFGVWSRGYSVALSLQRTGT